MSRVAGDEGAGESEIIEDVEGDWILWAVVLGEDCPVQLGVVLLINSIELSSSESRSRLFIGLGSGIGKSPADASSKSTSL
jgi:hypothetical protein